MLSHGEVDPIEGIGPKGDWLGSWASIPSTNTQHQHKHSLRLNCAESVWMLERVGVAETPDIPDLGLSMMSDPGD